MASRTYLIGKLTNHRRERHRISVGDPNRLTETRRLQTRTCIHRQKRRLPLQAPIRMFGGKRTSPPRNLLRGIMPQKRNTGNSLPLLTRVATLHLRQTTGRLGSIRCKHRLIRMSILDKSFRELLRTWIPKAINTGRKVRMTDRSIMAMGLIEGRFRSNQTRRNERGTSATEPKRVV